MFDFMGILGKVQEGQARVAEARAKVAAMEFTESVAEGAVRATLTGDRVITELYFVPALTAEPEKLTVYIQEAINSALERIDLTYKQEIKTATEGLIPNIPGLDLSALGM